MVIYFPQESGHIGSRIQIEEFSKTQSSVFPPRTSLVTQMVKNSPAMKET